MTSLDRQPVQRRESKTQKILSLAKTPVRLASG